MKNPKDLEPQKEKARAFCQKMGIEISISIKQEIDEGRVNIMKEKENLIHLCSWCKMRGGRTHQEAQQETVFEKEVKKKGILISHGACGHCMDNY